MALSLRDRTPLKPEIRLAQAVSEFEAILTSEQKVSFSASRSSAASTAPSMSDVMRLTAEIDLKATNKHGRGRCLGPRMTNILQSIQQFAALGDVIIGGSQNLIACGVWAAARMTLHVMTGYFTYLEKLSFLLMSVGRSAPRYQALAVIYPRSKNLQRYLYEYFIIVTRLCHQSITWTHKSSLQRLSSSISDSDMKSFQSDLEVWSTSIKEEANLLLNQKVDEEAKQNNSFRTWITNRDGRLHWQEKIKSCVAFLDACSRYDHRTPWKQSRKHGTTSILKTCDQYQLWKSSQSNNCSIVVHGKLGAGKSVLLANIVDDLNLQDNTIVLYLFSRHDDFSSLQARTILGSLIRQFLEVFVTDDNFSHIFEDTISGVDLEDIMTIFKKLPSHSRKVYVVVDGLDECPSEEQQTAQRCLAVLQSIGYKLCISVRTPERTTIWDQGAFQFQLSIPEDNPDIVDYVQVEVDNRVKDGRLIIRDPGLVKDVKKELMRGAGGMFLWVTLQLESICMEMSDHDIREAIKDLPSDLTQTYERNLTKANAKDSKCYHIRIFKLLVSAKELFTTEQLREAVSVNIGNTTWDPSREVGAIDAVLRFCGSLVMVDEEDNTVRFIHHSARSFCLNSPRNGTEWTFTKKQADENMAETLITYLSYNVFETRLSRNRVPDVDVNEIPKKIALSALSKGDIGASFAGKLFKPRSLPRHNVGPLLAEAGAFRRKEEHEQFFLLPYASKRWLQHTAHLDGLSSLPQWYRLLDHPTFGIDLDDVAVPAGMRSRSNTSYGHPIASRHMIWALQHGHILLLKHELTAPRGIRRIQAYVALWLYLINIDSLTITETMDYQLVKWLCPMFLRLGMDHPAKFHFMNRLSVFDDDHAGIVEEAIILHDMEAIAALLRHDNLSQSKISYISPQLIDLAISHGQTSILHGLIENGYASNMQANTISVIRVLTSSMPDPVLLRFLRLFVTAGIDVSVLRDDELYIAIKLLCSYKGNSRTSRGVFKTLLPEPTTATVPYRRDALLHRACLNGDVEVADHLLRCFSDPNTRTDESSCLDATLYGLSQDRLGIVWLLLQFSAKPGRTTVVRAIQFRQWALALYLLSAYAAPTKLHDASGLDSQDPVFLVNGFDHDYELKTLFRFPVRIPENSVHTRWHSSGPPLLQLPILKSNCWLDWQFLFIPRYFWRGKWIEIYSKEHSRFTKQVYEDMMVIPSYAEKAPIEHSTNTVTGSSPYVSQCWLQYVLVREDATPWIRITTPSCFSVIAEVCGKWKWISFSERWDEPEEMVRITELIDQRRRRYDLVRSGLAESQWAVRELGKSLILLGGLPHHGCKFYVHDARVPAKNLPRWSSSKHGHMERFGFDFAYMSVRIHWLRTLKRLLEIGSLTYSDFPKESLQDFGEILGAPPEVLKQNTTYRHGIMPIALEAGFLGFYDYSCAIVKQNSNWLSEVTSWLENVDPAIFTWAMSRDAPLSFTRAFETFREVGVSEDEMERLKSALDVARSKLVELM